MQELWLHRALCAHSIAKGLTSNSSSGIHFEFSSSAVGERDSFDNLCNSLRVAVVFMTAHYDVSLDTLILRTVDLGTSPE